MYGIDDCYLIKFGQCAFGTKVAGELIKKPTRLLTNWRCRCRLARKCSRDHVHAQLCGRTLLNKEGVRVPATRLAAAYSRELGLDWARLAKLGLAEDCVQGAPSPSLRRWHMFAIYFGGDAHPHPGPSARDRAVGRDVLRVVDIRSADVNEVTATTYDEAFGDFEIFMRWRDQDPVEILRHRGTRALITAATGYLHSQYKEHKMSSSSAATFLLF